MEPLRIEEDVDTPKIVFDKTSKTFELSGRSLPEDTAGFYTRVYHWLEMYKIDPLDETTVKFKIDYFNSASQKAIGEILEYFAEIKNLGKKVTIEWYFSEDDEDMVESGEDYADLTHLDFVYKTLA